MDWVKGNNPIFGRIVKIHEENVERDNWPLLDILTISRTLKFWFIWIKIFWKLNKIYNNFLVLCFCSVCYFLLQKGHKRRRVSVGILLLKLDGLNISQTVHSINKYRSIIYPCRIHNDSWMRIFCKVYIRWLT